jgi:hypothetical protein
VVGVSDGEDDVTGDDAAGAGADGATDAERPADAAPTDAGGPDTPGDRHETASDRGSGPAAGRLTTYLLWGAVAALGVLAVVAAAGLYGSLSSIIDVWIGDRYRPFARAVLNFGVLCAAAAGVAICLRRL